MEQKAPQVPDSKETGQMQKDGTLVKSHNANAPSNSRGPSEQDLQKVGILVKSHNANAPSNSKGPLNQDLQHKSDPVQSHMVIPSSLGKRKMAFPPLEFTEIRKQGYQRPTPQETTTTTVPQPIIDPPPSHSAFPAVEKAHGCRNMSSFGFRQRPPSPINVAVRFADFFGNPPQLGATTSAGNTREQRGDVGFRQRPVSPINVAVRFADFFENPPQLGTTNPHG